MDAVVPNERAFWFRVWAGRILNRAERERFWSLRATDNRRLQWLAGRSAAKEAIRELLLSRGVNVDLADVEIVPDEQGCPHATGPWREALAENVVVSIAHTDGVAVATARFGVPGSQFLGVDVERVGRRADSFASTAFVDAERALLDEVPAQLRDEWALRAWCAKEAVGKALGHGLPDGPHAVAVSGLHLASGLAEVCLRSRLAETFPELAKAPLIVYTSRDDDVIVAATEAKQSRAQNVVSSATVFAARS